MAQVVVLQPRDVLFAEGSPANSIYAVVDGTIVLSMTKDEKTTALTHCGAGICFGELVRVLSLHSTRF